MKRIAALLALSLSAVFADAASAQQRAGPTRSEIQARTEFYESYKREQWSEAERVFEESLARHYLGALKDKDLVYRYCEALVRQKAEAKSAKAARALEKLVQREPDFPQALVLLAKIRAKSKKKEDRADSEDLLLRAARLGFPVLNELGNPKSPELFKDLKPGARFLLRVMRSQQDAALGARIYDPFRVSASRKPGPGEEPPPERLLDPAKLEAQVEALFARIEGLLESEDSKGLEQAFARIGELQTEYEGLGGQRVIEKIRDWKKRREGYRDAQQVILCRAYVRQGRELLRDMARALSEEKYDRVFGFNTRVATLADAMRAEAEPVFLSNAQAIVDRAQAMNAEARDLKRIRDFKLALSGIVLDPFNASDGERRGNACLINDRPYTEGQILVDDEGEPIEGLSVIEIQKGAVVFQYRGRSFVRELTPAADEDEAKKTR